ncbi:MAG: hypothetical protein KME04_11815 [Pleurocapsa minor GSE-CHR-MK-17-07R]|jgi:hypothetical protein|nr:hypothetical protein [Pleurocapsa minor GSE-CHR-MK 17-07R]
MANTDRARKLLIRSALVTTTTIATVFGAQNLAMLDARQILELTQTPAPEAITLVPLADGTSAPATVAQQAPALTIQQAAPSIIILRQSGQASAASQPIVSAPAAPSAPQSSQAVIQPPAPQQLSAPAPVIMQQAVPQVSRSTR